jgi:ketosteroid isomerase-like protein
MRRARLALLPALLALALVACGESEEEPTATTQGDEPPAAGEPAPEAEEPAASAEEEEIRAAVQDYLGGLATENAPQVCDALTEQAQRVLGRDLGIEAGQCEEAAGEVASFATGQAQQALSDADAVDIEVMGDRATAQISLAGATVPIELERQEDGEWRVSDANEDALREALP